LLEGTVPVVDQLMLTTADGRELEADLMMVEGADRAVVLCHPHPTYGGTRFDRMIQALFDTLPSHGVTVCRFDFRRDDGGGVLERLDALAAIDMVALRCPDSAIHLLGYSFGAHVALSVEHERIVTKIAIAPALPAMPVDPPRHRALVLVPEHDDFCPPDTAGPIVSQWPDAHLEIIEMTDHFLGGRVIATADRVAAWLARN
jgi:alpha/beta superfamily hydrolase